MVTKKLVLANRPDYSHRLSRCWFEAVASDFLETSHSLISHHKQLAPKVGRAHHDTSARPRLAELVTLSLAVEREREREREIETKVTTALPQPCSSIPPVRPNSRRCRRHRRLST